MKRRDFLKGLAALPGVAALGYALKKTDVGDSLARVYPEEVAKLPEPPKPKGNQFIPPEQFAKEFNETLAREYAKATAKSFAEHRPRVAPRTVVSGGGG